MNKTGITIKLTQNAYIAGVPGEEHYEAAAVDADGNKYLVTWDIRPEWQAWADEQQAAGYYLDEGDACDWEHPASIVRLEPWADVTGKVAGGLD